LGNILPRIKYLHSIGYKRLAAAGLLPQKPHIQASMRICIPASHDTLGNSS
jgi:hypothetical protein